MPHKEVRKGGILAVQVRVPKELQALIGHKVLRRSTETKDDREYDRRSPATIDEFLKTIDTARAQLRRRFRRRA